MAGYLGKISAIVSVNTSDIASKVQSGFAEPFDKALRQIETRIRSTNTSVNRSFSNIYTEGQKVARAVAAAKMGAVKNFEGDPDALIQRFRASKSIANPLGELANQIERAGSTVSGMLTPQLVAAQSASQSLFDKMAAGAMVSEKEINGVAAAVSALDHSFNSVKATAEAFGNIYAEVQKVAMSSREVRASGTPNANAEADAILQRYKARIHVAEPLGDIARKIGESPADVRVKLGPQLVAAQNDAEALFAKIKAGAKVSDDEIRSVVMTVNHLKSAFERTALAAQFKGKFSDFLNDTAAQKYTAELAAVQSRMAAIGASAGGPVSQAIDKYREKLVRAAEAGELGFNQTRRELRALLEEVGSAAAKEGLVSEATAKAMIGGITRTGDIGRGGVDKFNLAMGQAMFAIDDFFSATGGIEQKLRAVSNNVTQMGFIIGKEFGLFAALTVTVGIQLFLMLRKFTGATDEAKRKEDELKASTESLNSSLERQKTLAEELSKTYRDLGRDIIASTATAQGGAMAAAANKAEDLREKQRAARAAFFSETPAGTKTRASQSILEKQLADETDEVRRSIIAGKLASERGLGESRFSSLEANARALASEMPAAQIRRRVTELQESKGSLAGLIEGVRNTPNYGVNQDRAMESLMPQFKGINEQLAVFEMALKIASDDAKALGAEGFTVLSGRIQKMQSDLASLGPESDAGHLQGRLAAIGQQMKAATETAETASEMQRRIAELSAKAGGVLEDSAAFIREEKAAVEARKEAERESKKAEDARLKSLERGAELLMSPSGGKLSAFRKDLEDATLAAGGPGGAGVAEFVKNRLLEAAPGLAQMEQERAMAIKPPYFQALQASDATAAEGQKELNRLLRGEDASKDKNLDELKTQSELLRDLIAIARQQGIVVDL